MLGLKEIQKYWEVNNLVLKLFFQYLDESTARKLRNVEYEDPSDLVTRASEPQTSRTNQFSGSMKDVSPSSARTATEGAPRNGIQIPVQPLASLLSEETFSFNFPGNMLNSSEGFNPFLDMSMSIHDGLDEEGLDFLQRCL